MRQTSGAEPPTWRAPGSGALEYRELGSGPAALVGEVANPALAAAVETTARLQHVTLAGDGRLALLAAFAAQQVPKGATTLPPELIEFVARHLGLYDVTPDLIVVDVPRDDAMGAVSRGLTPRLLAHAYTHYGAALVAHEGASRLVIALSSRALTLAPVPRRLPIGQPIALRGRLAPTYTNPRIEVTEPNGAPRLLAAGTGLELDVRVPTPSAGLHRVEISGEDANGPSALAGLWVYVGDEPPSTFTLRGSTQALDLGTLQRDLFASANAERSRAGLPALERDPALDRIALAHSTDMRDHGFVGHDSKASGGPADRVEHAGLGRGLVLENILRGHDLASLEDSARAQAGSRSNLLHPEITHVGFGIVQLHSSHGDSLLVTELFMQQTRAIDANAAAPQLLSMLNDTRATRSARALANDPELASVAQAAAQEFVTTPGASEQSVIDAANAKLQRFSVTYRRVAALLVLARTLEDARALEPALDPQIGNVGIGVAQGMRADRGGHVLVLAIVLAWPR